MYLLLIENNWPSMAVASVSFLTSIRKNAAYLMLTTHTHYYINRVVDCSFELTPNALSTKELMMAVQKNYPWRIAFSDGSFFELSDSDRDALLVKIREGTASDKDEVKIETNGRLGDFCNYIYGNMDGDRIHAILKTALPTTWRRYNMSHGTLEAGQFGSGLKIFKLDPKDWRKPTQAPGYALENSRPFTMSTYLGIHCPARNELRTNRFAHPSTLQPGDILATGEIVLSLPRGKNEGQIILLHISGGFEGYWLEVSPLLPIALLVEGDEGYSTLKELALQARNQFIENTAP